MRRSVMLFAVLLAACGSSNRKSTNTSTTTTEAPATSTIVAATTSVAPTSTTSSVPGSTLTVVRFAGPQSPVPCNAQTTLVEMQWEIPGATKTVLSIDGSPFATFSGGTHQGLEPLECDGASHVYTVRGTSAQGGEATRSLTLTTKPPS